MSDNRRVCVGIVTFEPDIAGLRRLLGMLCGHTMLTVCDNSNCRSIRESVRRLCNEFGCDYMSAERNGGTGWGINALVAHAMSKKYEWLVYFDQDSVPEVDYVAEVERLVSRDQSSIAVFAPGVINGRAVPTVARGSRPQLAIASGMALRVGAWLRVGGMDELLFLDGVDHEYCYAVHRERYRVQIEPTLSIVHTVGDSQRIVGSDRVLSEHPRWRRELMWRNVVILARRYYREAPIHLIRQVGGLAYDSVLAAIAYRRGYYLTSCVAGARSGLRVNARRERWSDLALSNSALVQTQNAGANMIVDEVKKSK